MPDYAKLQSELSSLSSSSKQIVAKNSGDFSSDYAKLQSELLSLSSNSKQIFAENSGHFVIIDRPDVVVDGIRQVVDAVRTKGTLSGSTAAFDHGLQ